MEYQSEEMSPEQLKTNIAKMTVVWSACSFSSYLLNFMNKYLEGSIFENNYAEGLAGGLATIVGASLYSRVGMKQSLLISFGFSLLGGALVCLLEGKAVDLPHSYLNEFENLGDHMTDKKLTTLALNYLVPKLIFIAKFGIQLATLSTYTASFSDDNIFPADRRATAIGQCQIVARGLTILSPEVTELPKPQPMIIYCVLVSLALGVSLSF